MSAAEALVAAARGCPAVADVSAGRFGEAAAYLPGRRVEGVRIDEERVELHVVARWGVPLTDLAGQVRTACTPLAGGRRVDVAVDDVELPPGATPQPAPAPG